MFLIDDTVGLMIFLQNLFSHCWFIKNLLYLQYKWYSYCIYIITDTLFSLCYLNVLISLQIMASLEK